jgi:hypothetical protein
MADDGLLEASGSMLFSSSFAESCVLVPAMAMADIGLLRPCELSLLTLS